MSACRRVFGIISGIAQKFIMKKELSSKILMVLSALCFSTIGIFTKLLAPFLNEFSIVAYRLGFGLVVFLFIFILSKEKLLDITKKDLKYFALYGSLAIPVIGATIGFLLTSVANVIFLFFLYPIFALTLSKAFLKEKITKIQILSAFIGITGVIFIFGFQVELIKNTTELMGSLLGLLAGFFWAVYMVFSKWLRKSYSYRKLSFWGFLFAFIYVLPLFVLFGQPSAFIQPGFEMWISLGGLGLISTLGAYGFYIVGIKNIKASTSGLIFIIEAISAVVLAFLFLGEVPPPATIAGGFLILIAAGLALKE